MNRLVSAIVGVVLAMSWSEAARADDPSSASPNATPTTNRHTEGPADTGFSLGARLGYMIPMGSAAQDSDLSKTFSGGIPIIIDAGYRLNPNIYLGLYAQYGFLFIPSSACPSPASCSGHDIRVGVNVHYHVSPKENIDPWVGAGIGLEWAGASETVSGVSGSSSLNGFEFLNLQLGVDFKATPEMRVGPFVGFSLAQYNSITTSSGDSSSSGDITNKALHEWLTLGVRGQYDL